MSRFFLRLYQYVYKINFILSKIFTRIGGGVIIIMSIIIFAQVIKRYLFNAPFEWAEEATIYLMVYVTFLCLPYITLLNKNISMTLIYDKIAGKRMGYVLDMVISGTFLFILILWVPLAINLFLSSNTVSALQLPIKRSVVHAVIPVSFMLTLLICIQKVLKAIVGVCAPLQAVAIDEIERAESRSELDDIDTRVEEIE